MDVTDQLQQIDILLADNRFVTVLKQMAATAVAMVELTADGLGDVDDLMIPGPAPFSLSLTQEQKQISRGYWHLQTSFKKTLIWRNVIECRRALGDKYN